MIIFISENKDSNIVYNSRKSLIKKHKELNYDVNSLTCEMFTYHDARVINDCINNTENMQSLDLCDVEFQKDNTYIYPIMISDLSRGFGYKNIYAFFEVLPEIILDKVRSKEVYIAFFAITEGIDYDSNHLPDSKSLIDFGAITCHKKSLNSVIEDSCASYNIPKEQILLITCGKHSHYLEDVNLLHLNYYALELNYKIKLGYMSFLKKLSVKKEKHFICANSRIRPHRYHLVYELYRNDLLKHGYVSCQSFDSWFSQFPSEIFQGNINSLTKKLQEDNVNIAEFMTFYNTLPYYIDMLNDENAIENLSSSWITNHRKSLGRIGQNDKLNHISTYYERAVMDIITESNRSDKNVNFLSEKTFRTIMHKMPFIISGDKGIHNELTRHGFKLYDMLFDYSFDNYDSYIDRNIAIISQLKKYCDMPIEDFYNRTRQDDVQEVIEHNYKVLESNSIWNEFANKLKTQIK